MALLLAIALIGPLFAEGASEIEKWVGPVLTTAAAFFAALFAWLTTRDKLKHDKQSAIDASEIKHLKEEIEECKEDRGRITIALEQVRANFSAHLLKRPLPFPDQLQGSSLHRPMPPPTPPPQ